MTYLVTCRRNADSLNNNNQLYGLTILTVEVKTKPCLRV
jgi:hypothetical protein